MDWEVVKASCFAFFLITIIPFLFLTLFVSGDMVKYDKISYEKRQVESKLASVKKLSPEDYYKSTIISLTEMEKEMEASLEKRRLGFSYRTHEWIGAKWNENLGAKSVAPK